MGKKSESIAKKIITRNSLGGRMQQLVAEAGAWYGQLSKANAVDCIKTMIRAETFERVAPCKIRNFSALERLIRRGKRSAEQARIVCGLSARPTLEAICRAQGTELGKTLSISELFGVRADVSLAMSSGVELLSRRGSDCRFVAAVAHAAPWLRHEAGQTEWKNGRPLAYTRATNDTVVQGCFLVRGKTIEIARNQQYEKFGIPTGYAVSADDLGLFLYRKNDMKNQAHIDWRNALPLDAARAEILRLEIARKNQEAEKTALEKLEKSTIPELALAVFGRFVSLDDSIAAGNCRSGSEAWAAKQKITAAEIPATELIRHRNDGRVARVLARVLVSA